MPDPLEKSSDNASLMQQMYAMFFGVQPLPDVPPPSPQGSDNISVSSVKKSESEHKNDPAVPYLFAPQVDPQDYSTIINKLSNISGVEQTQGNPFLLEMRKEYNEFCINLLDKWSENVKEIAEQQQKRAVSTFYLALKDYIQQSERSEETNAAGIASMMMIAAALVSGVIGVGAVVQNVSIQAIQQAIAPVLAFAGDMRAELGLIGALFGTASMYQATAQTLLSKGSAGGDLDLAFGRNFANDVIRTITGADFNQFLTSMIAVREGTPESKNNFPALAKLALLLNAMALMTKLEVGHLTAEELGAMIMKKIKFEGNDPRTRLVELINAQLDLLDPQIKADVLNALLTYYDNNPSVQNMANPIHALRTIFNKEAEAGKVTQQNV